jgi:hypothetical protein
MKINSTIAAALLVASGAIAAQAFAQGAPAKAAAAQRLQKLQAQRDAAVAAAKAQQNQINRPVTTPTTTPTATPTATPTTTPTAVTTRPTTTPTTTTTPTAASTGKPAASSSAAAAPSSSVAPKPVPPPTLGLDLEELKKTRPERRSGEIQQLKARWGELLRNDRAVGELKQHAQRTAYLQRIRALASKANDAKTVQAVDVLITKEDTRNADAMNALRSGALPAPVAGATK